ncbi:MAG: DUF4910 domain-containing protein [Bacteroidales bacterium]|nr:DUF4910 domain-containing protein [Bacteroidales bacterium]
MIKSLKISEKGYGALMIKLINELYPICRSITGNGVRNTLKIVNDIIPLTVSEIPSGTKAFDWEVPKEWNINEAYIKDLQGNEIINFKKLNLHVLNYSAAIEGKIPAEELKKHIHTLPDRPDWVPYRTSYYQENWGFCMSHNQFKTLKDDTYEIKIDSTLENGSLTYGEYYIKGETTEEVLISTHICHPSLCNDNLSGISIATYLAHLLSQNRPRYSYRFLFIPGTIGSIVWLSRNEKQTKRIRHGLVITLLGDTSDFTYKRSRRGNAIIDQAVEHYFNSGKVKGRLINFYPYGYDERQYCSPGFNLPVGSLTRNQHGEFPEYHTSADNLNFVHSDKLEESLQAILDILYIIENNNTYINLNPKCEPLLGKRGLYDKIGGGNESKLTQMAALWVLNQSDGSQSLLDIAKRSNTEFRIVREAAEALVECNLLKTTADDKS